MKPVYLFGDSHVATLEAKAPELFIPNGIHSVTAYLVGKKFYEPYFENILKKIPYMSPVLVSFGEIDCSSHIYKNMQEQGTSLKESVNINIRSYKRALMFLKTRYLPLIMGVYPQETNSVKPETVNGTVEDQLLIREEFNRQLTEICTILRIPFISIMDYVLKENWHNKSGYYRDYNHLGECMIPIVQSQIENAFERPITVYTWKEVNGFFSVDEGEELQRLCRGKVHLEVGSFYGKSTVCASEVAKEVHCVDTWAIDGDGQTQKPEITNIFEAFANYVYKHDNVFIRPGFSTEMVPTFLNSYFDSIFIDATHTFEEVLKDVEVCAPKLKDDGVFIFHDYGGWEGVTRAVDRLFAVKGPKVNSVISANKKDLICEMLHNQ